MRTGLVRLGLTEGLESSKFCSVVKQPELSCRQGEERGSDTDEMLEENARRKIRKNFVHSMTGVSSLFTV